MSSGHDWLEVRRKKGSGMGNWLSLAKVSPELWAHGVWHPNIPKWQAGVREDLLELLNWIMETWSFFRCVVDKDERNKGYRRRKSNDIYKCRKVWETTLCGTVEYDRWQDVSLCFLPSSFYAQRGLFGFNLSHREHKWSALDPNASMSCVMADSSGRALPECCSRFITSRFWYALLFTVSRLYWSWVLLSPNCAVAPSA